MKEDIIKLLEPMIAEAEEKGLMIQCIGVHSEVRLTPEKFRECLNEGRFVWGPVNWRLEKPTDRELGNMTFYEACKPGAMKTTDTFVFDNAFFGSVIKIDNNYFAANDHGKRIYINDECSAESGKIVPWEHK